MKIQKKVDWTKYEKNGMRVCMILVIGLATANAIRLNRVMSRKKPIVIRKNNDSQIEDKFPPLKEGFVIARDTNDEFMRAIFEKEQGPIENPYNITMDFRNEAAEQLGLVPDKLNLADRRVCKMLVIGYFMRYKPESIQDAGAMYAGGPSGRHKAKWQRWGWEVHNLYKLYMRERNEKPVPLAKMGE